MILTSPDTTTGAGGKVGERVTGSQGKTFVLIAIIDLTCLWNHAHASVTAIPCHVLQVLPINC